MHVLSSISAFLALAATVHAVFPAPPKASEAVDRYLVKFRDWSNGDTVLDALNKHAANTTGQGVIRQFNKDIFNGFAGNFSAGFLTQLMTTYASSIDYIERDVRVYAALLPTSTQTSPPNWGLTRISQHTRKTGDPYRYFTSAGKGISVYIIDSGVQVNHTDLGGRAIREKNFVVGEPDEDYIGHGTHVAGIIGGTLYGVAKNVTLKSLKVLDKSGAGYTSDVIAAVNYVVGLKLPAGKAAINMSLGGSKSTALNSAVSAAYKAGVPVLVAAGNDGGDACKYSPSSEPNAFTIGSIGTTDKRSSFSNSGTCVDIYAPGENILSLGIGQVITLTVTLSGTSMATPFMAGIAALLMGAKSYTSAAGVYQDMTRYATSTGSTSSWFSFFNTNSLKVGYNCYDNL